MKFTKHTLRDIEKCYATLGIVLEDAPCLFFAGEGNGSVRAFQGESFQKETLIWEGGGGTMSIVPVPGETNVILASRGFYSMVDSTTSTIEIIRYDQGVFTHEEIAKLPYLHRFDVVCGADGTRYILACSIASHKESKEDWSHPGQIFWGKLPDALAEPFTVNLEPLPGLYTTNHGFCKQSVDGGFHGFIGCTEGLFQVTPPAVCGQDWAIAQLMDFPVSDVAVLDIDEDGQIEIAIITAFHGDKFLIFKKGEQGYDQVYAYPVPHDFYHTVISCHLNGVPAFVGGGRKLAMELFAIVWDKEQQAFVPSVADRDVGPSNAAVLNLETGDLLLSANRQIGQAAYYTLEE